MKLHLIILTALSALLLTGCGNSGTPHDSAIAVRLTPGGEWSLYQKNGKLLYRNALQYRPDALANGYFITSENNGFCLYRADSRPVRVTNASDLYSAGIMNDGMIPVAAKNSRITVIDGEGNTLFTLDTCDGAEIVKCGAYVSDGRLTVVSDKGLHGYCDTDGHYVIKPQYALATPFSDGAAAVMTDDGKACIIKTDGSVRFSFADGISITGLAADGRFVIADRSGSFYVADKNGATALSLPENVTKVTALAEDHVVYVQADGKYNAVRLNGKVLFGTGCKYIVPVFGSNFFVVSADGKKYIASSDGSKEMDLEQFAEAEAPQPVLARYVETGHYEPDALTNYISGIVKPEGLGDYTFGQLPRFNFVNPFEYTGKKDGHIMKLSGKVRDYRIDVSAGFDRPMAVVKDGKDVWDNDARLISFTIKITSENPIPPLEAVNLAKSLQLNGFTETARTVNNDIATLTLRNGTTVATVTRTAAKPTLIAVTLSKG